MFVTPYNTHSNLHFKLSTNQIFFIQIRLRCYAHNLITFLTFVSTLPPHIVSLFQINSSLCSGAPRRYVPERTLLILALFSLRFFGQGRLRIWVHVGLDVWLVLLWLVQIFDLVRGGGWGLAFLSDLVCILSIDAHGAHLIKFVSLLPLYLVNSQVVFLWGFVLSCLLRSLAVCVSCIAGSLYGDAMYSGYGFVSAVISASRSFWT